MCVAFCAQIVLNCFLDDDENLLLQIAIAIGTSVARSEVHFPMFLSLAVVDGLSPAIVNKNGRPTYSILNTARHFRQNTTLFPNTQYVSRGTIK